MTQDKELEQLLFKGGEVDTEAIELFNHIFKMGEKIYFYSKTLNDLVDLGYKVEDTNPRLIYHVKNDYKNQVVLEKKGRDTKEVLKNKNILYNAEVLNKIEFLKESVDLFANKTKIVKSDRVLTITQHKYFFTNLEKPSLSEQQQQEIINDYKEHFKEFDLILKFIVACRFTSDRRDSFLHLLVNAGWGKSFFMGLLKANNLVVQMKYEDFKSPCGVRPELFRNKLGLCIDEFTQFKKEFKELTNNIVIEPKFGFSTEVEVYAKLFFSAEESKSFMIAASDQITERVNVLDKRRDNEKLIERELYSKVGNAIYFEVIAFYMNTFIKNEFEKYVEMGKIKSGLVAREILGKIYDSYGLKHKTEKIETYMKSKILLKLEQLHNDRRTKPFDSIERADKELLGYLVFSYEKEKLKEIIVKNPSKFYNLFLNSEDLDTQSKAKYLSINTIFEKETKRMRHNSELLSGFIITNKELEESNKLEEEIEQEQEQEIKKLEEIDINEIDIQELPF